MALSSRTLYRHLQRKDSGRLDLEHWTLEDHRAYVMGDRRAWRRCWAHLSEHEHLWELDARAMAAELARLPGIGEGLAFRFVAMLHYEHTVARLAQSRLSHEALPREFDELDEPAE